MIITEGRDFDYHIVHFLFFLLHHLHIMPSHICSPSDETSPGIKWFDSKFCRDFSLQPI